MSSSWSELKMYKIHSLVQHLQRHIWVDSDSRRFVVLNRRNIQGNFFDKKCSKKKSAEMRKPSRFMWLKYTLKVAETNFRTGTTWYFFCRPNLSFDFFYLEKTKNCTHLSECIKLHVRIKRSWLDALTFQWTRLSSKNRVKNFGTPLGAYNHL